MIEVVKLSKRYRSKTIFNECSFNIYYGITYIIGENGAGKSSLNKILYREEKYNGSIKIDGIELCDIDIETLRQKYISYLPQQLTGYESFSLEELVTTFIKPENRNKVEKLLEHFEFNSFYTRSIKNLSGGEKQKAILILTLLKNTPILILDEYENNLDNVSIKQLEELLQTINKCVIIISHRTNVEGCNYIEIKDTQVATNYVHTQVVKIPQKPTKDRINIVSLYFKKNIGPRIFYYALLFITIFLAISSICYAMNYYQGHKGINAQVSELYSDTAMIIVAPGLDQSVLNYKEDIYNNESQLFFTNEDVEKLNNSDMVNYTEITAPVTANMNNIGYNGNEIEHSYQYNETTINLEYTTTSHSKRVVENTEVQPNNILYGMIPEDGKSNSVVIPLSYAYTLTSDVETLINKEITLETKNLDTSEENTSTFVISGIYDDTTNDAYNSENNEENSAYVYGAFDIANATTIKNYPSLILTEGTVEQQEQAMQSLYDNVSIRAMSYGITVDYEAFSETNKDGITAVYIEASSPEEVEEISEIINTTYPYAGIYSKESYTSGAPESYFTGLKTQTIKKILIITVAFIIICLLLLFNYFKMQIDFYNLISFMGVSKKEKIKVDIIELIIICVVAFGAIILSFYVMGISSATNPMLLLVAIIYIIFIYALVTTFKYILGRISRAKS